MVETGIRNLTVKALSLRFDTSPGPVVAELVWDIPVNNVVVMDIWMSAASHEAMDFLKGFKSTAEQLAYNLRVVPHYHIFSLPSGQDYEQIRESSRKRKSLRLSSSKRLSIGSQAQSKSLRVSEKKLGTKSEIHDVN